jgi:hypothetical protein
MHNMWDITMIEILYLNSCCENAEGSRKISEFLVLV